MTRVETEAPTLIMKERHDFPMVLRDARGRVRWHLPGNTLEENEQIGIRNIQGLFLERFPEFDELFPRDKDGKIDQTKMQEAQEFILQYVGITKKFLKVFSGSPTIKQNAPYFGSSHLSIIKKAFSPWGIKFEQESEIPRDQGGRVIWKRRNNTPEENEQFGIRNVQALFLERFLEFDELFPRGEDGKIVEDKRVEAKRFILDHLGSHRKLAEIVGESPVKRESIPFFQGSFRVVLSKSFKPWGIEFLWESSATEGWVTGATLARELRKPRQTIIKIGNQFRGEHTKWIKNFLDSRSRPSEHYSPQLVTLIIETLEKYQKAPDGWMTNRALAHHFGKSEQAIKKFSNQLREQYPHLFQIYLDSIGIPHEHYAPQLKELLIPTLYKYSQAPEGWATNSAAAQRNRRAEITIRNLANKFREDHPQWFQLHLGSNGKLTEHYSPELIEEVTKLINKGQTLSPQEANELLRRFVEVA